jgi:hypothetical protein
MMVDGKVACLFDLYKKLIVLVRVFVNASKGECSEGTTATNS